MVIIQSYGVAVAMLVVTMLCWGSWANTLKLASKEWSFSLYYWDYSIGLILLSLIFGLTMGSSGDEGRSFIPDLLQANTNSLGSAVIGGVIFNLSNLLIVAATDIAGMAVAFPLAVGLALVIGVIVNYLAETTGNPYLLFIGVALVTFAIVVNALAYRIKSKNKPANLKKGIWLSIFSGIVMGFFYRFVAASMSLNFAYPETGKMTPYTAVFIFSVAIFLSNFLWNSIFMYKPITGEKATYRDYFVKGNFRLHMVGILGGLIWSLGLLFSLIAAEQAGPAISYGLGQGATMIAAAWGVFIWKEFKGAPKTVNLYLTTMFIFFISGLLLIILARIN
jgi:glucose uptake protein